MSPLPFSQQSVVWSHPPSVKHGCNRKDCHEEQDHRGIGSKGESLVYCKFEGSYQRCYAENLGCVSLYSLDKLTGVFGILVTR